MSTTITVVAAETQPGSFDWSKYAPFEEDSFTPELIPGNDKDRTAARRRRRTRVEHNRRREVAIHAAQRAVNAVRQAHAQLTEDFTVLVNGAKPTRNAEARNAALKARNLLSRVR